LRDNNCLSGKVFLFSFSGDMGEKLVSGNAGCDGDQSAASAGTPALD